MVGKLKKQIDKLVERDFNPNETRDFIRSSGPICWSWGMHEDTVIPNKGLLFKVQGHKHTGWVLIVLAWDDTYTIHYFDEDYELVDTQKMIYVDVLIETLDNRIETE